MRSLANVCQCCRFVGHKFRQNINTSRLYLSSKSSSSDDSSDDNSGDKLIKTSDKTSVTKPKKDYSRIAPEDDDYDPSKDPRYTNILLGFKYPQMFTVRQNFGFKPRAEQLKEELMLPFKEGKLWKRKDELGPPPQADFVIFGGGIIGSAIAYWLKQRSPNSYTVAVIERDSTYTRASTTLSVGGIRQQFSLPENILMSLFSVDFLRDVKKHLSVLDHEPPDICFHPHGYLILATESQAHQLLDSHKLQTELGAYVEIYTPKKLRERFPWLNLDGIALGSFGVQNEGWFDPWALLIAFRTKAESLGVEYINGELIDFNLKAHYNTGMQDDSEETLETCNFAIYRDNEGLIRQLEFAKGIVCCGAFSSFIAKKMGYGNKPKGVRSYTLPIEPRKRYVYVFNCPDAPVIDFPLLVDTSSVYCRREGLGGNFICGRSPNENEEPDTSNLDVDYTFFDNAVWPALANRVKAFESIKIKGAWAGYYEYNTLDQNPIIGKDPYYQNIFWATGFSGHGIQMAPAVGRAIMEMVIDGQYETIDLRRFGWGRVFRHEPLRELNIY